ncbi:putative phage phi-C31 gp36 major capsid-like protein [Bacteroidales bacterium Barb6XT]|nr:putative phage phi-C31 gp36 major capsid-like protein [Bacteroidales bacterium Barb6XT]OAV70057.1 putative phage phi-C31 gp36 major capsid-like protein [Bacteroidales bacterium Barb6XT]
MAKEKSITELQDEKKQLRTRSTEIIEGAKKENRAFKEEETKELNGTQYRMQEINLEIADIEATNAGKRQKHTTGKNFSLRKSLLELVDGGNYSEEVRAVNEAGRIALEASGTGTRSTRGLFIPVEARSSFTATGAAGTGSDLIETEFMDILAPLRDRLVLGQAGATLLTGLRSNIDIPTYSGSSAKWEAENAAAEDGGGTFSHKTMKPKRLTSILTVSRQLLTQDNLGVEQLLRSDLVNAVAGKLEATILGNADHSDTQPDGLFTGFAGAPVNLSWPNIVDLETKVDLANALAGNTGYIMHTILRGDAKAFSKANLNPGGAGSEGFVLESDGTMNGYSALRTNAMASISAPSAYGIIFGNWADLLIGQWGALDLMVDPYIELMLTDVRLSCSGIRQNRVDMHLSHADIRLNRAGRTSAQLGRSCEPYG